MVRPVLSLSKEPILRQALRPWAQCRMAQYKLFFSGFFLWWAKSNHCDFRWRSFTIILTQFPTWCVCLTKSEHILNRTDGALRAPNWTLGRAKRKGVGGKKFLPALAFRRRRISYFALRNAPQENMELCLPHPPVRTQQNFYSLCLLYNCSP